MATNLSKNANATWLCIFTVSTTVCKWHALRIRYIRQPPHISHIHVTREERRKPRAAACFCGSVLRSLCLRARTHSPSTVQGCRERLRAMFFLTPVRCTLSFSIAPPSSSRSGRSSHAFSKLSFASPRSLFSFANSLSWSQLLLLLLQHCVNRVMVERIFLSFGYVSGKSAWAKCTS